MNPVIRNGWIVGVVFLAGVGGVGALVVSSTSDRSFGVEPDYYAKALNWDRTARQRQENVRLNWHVRGEIIGIAPSRALRLCVTDGTGARIGGARVRVEAFPNVRSSERHTIWLEGLPQDPGFYAAGLPASTRGSWHIRASVSKAADTFTAEFDLAEPALHDGAAPDPGGRVP